MCFIFTARHSQAFAGGIHTGFQNRPYQPTPDHQKSSKKSCATEELVFNITLRSSKTKQRKDWCNRTHIFDKTLCRQQRTFLLSVPGYESVVTASWEQHSFSACIDVTLTLITQQCAWKQGEEGTKRRSHTDFLHSHCFDTNYTAIRCDWRTAPGN